MQKWCEASTLCLSMVLSLHLCTFAAPETLQTWPFYGGFITWECLIKSSAVGNG